MPKPRNLPLNPLNPLIGISFDLPEKLCLRLEALGLDPAVESLRVARSLTGLHKTPSPVSFGAARKVLGNGTARSGAIRSLLGA